MNALIKDRRLSVFTVAFIVLLWALLVLPAAPLNGLFPLDIGGIFSVVAHFPANLKEILSPYDGSGRYYPLYWLYHTCVASLCGYGIHRYFLALAVVFLTSALITGLLFAKLVRHSGIVLAFSLSLFLSSANVESLYALGKAEPLAYLFICVILALFHCGYSDDRPLPVPRCAAIAAAFTCSLWLKETAVALFVFPVAGMAATLLLTWRKVSFSPGARLCCRYTRLLFCLVVGFGVSKLPFLIFANTVGSRRPSYTAFSLTWQIVADNVVFYVTQQPDITVLGIIGSILLAYVLLWLPSLPAALRAGIVHELIFVGSLMVMAWAYLGIFVFWRWPMAYYLYLPAIVFRFCTGYSFYIVIRFGLGGRLLRLGSSIAILVLLCYTVIYLWYTGASQVRFSQVYTEALDAYVRESRAGDSLIFESYPFYSEQVGGTQRVLQTVYHQARRLYGIADLIDPAVVTPQMKQLLGVSDADLANNEKNWPKRNDYVIVMTGDELATWQVRGVAPYYSEGSLLQKDGAYDMQQIAGGRSYFPTAFMNIWTLNLDVRQCYVGYEIYRVIRGPRFTWLGRYPDGWMGRRARLTLDPEYVANALVHVSASKYTPDNRVRVFQDDVLIETAALREGMEHTFNVRPVPGKGPTVFRFEVDRTFVPRNLHVNRDRRELGLFVRFEPFAAKT